MQWAINLDHAHSALKLENTRAIRNLVVTKLAQCYFFNFLSRQDHLQLPFICMSLLEQCKVKNFFKRKILK